MAKKTVIIISMEKRGYAYKVYELLGKRFYVYPKNAIISCAQIPRAVLESDSSADGVAETDGLITSLTICLSISNSCNMKCDYCFNGKKDGRLMDAADAISYLDSAIARGARAEKYYVDLSGSGEPLLNFPAVLRISQWCKKKSDELRREVLPRLVTNGLLLSPKIAKVLQSNGVLFGVSLDGDRAIHNKHRIDMGGNATFDIVLDNVLKIENREYIGCAVTITKDVFPLFEALESLLPYFRTISVRPVRGPFGLDEKSLRDWLHEYDEMAMRICERMKTGDIALLLALLNGEDYLGTFLSNMLVRKKRLTRCDAYISRFAIGIEGEVGGCPSENGSRPPIKPEERLERAVMECAGCDFKYFCGGVCPIEKDEEALRIECEFQKHLVLLSAYILDEAMHYPGEFRRLRDLSYQKLERNRLDTELDDFLNRYKEYTFTEGKKVFDALKRRY